MLFLILDAGQYLVLFFVLSLCLPDYVINAINCVGHKILALTTFYSQLCVIGRFDKLFVR